MNEITAVLRARQLLAKLETLTIPVDVAAIAAEYKFEVRESDELEKGEAGYVIVKNSRKIIILNKHDHPFRKRFTVLHELAHHVLELPSVHGEKLGSNELESFNGRQKEEILCDIFAAECIVPWKLIQPLTEHMDFTAETIRNLSDDFQASKQCVASRFTQASSMPLAYVIAEDGIIQNVFPSKSLREKGVWIKSGRLPESSAATLAIRNCSLFESADLDGSEWSTSDHADRFACYEEAVHLAEWRQTLSLLTFEEQSGSFGHSNHQNSDEDELLPELTGHLPWPKR